MHQVLAISGAMGGTLESILRGLRWLYRWPLRYPVAIASWTIIWLGAISVCDALFASLGASGVPIVGLFGGSYFLAVGLSLLLFHVRAGLASVAGIGSLLFLTLVHVPTFEAIGNGSSVYSFWIFKWFVVGVLLSSALVTGSLSARRVARLLAYSGVALAVVFRFGALFSFVDTGFDGLTTENLALLVSFIVGGAVLAYTRRERKRSDAGSQVRNPIIIGGTLVAVLSWFTLTSADHRMTKQHAEAVGDRIVTVVRKTLSQQLSMVGRVAESWDTITRLSDSYAQKEFASYISDTPAMRTLVVLDGQNQVRWGDGKVQTQLWLQNALLTDAAHQWLSHVRETGTVHLSSQKFEKDADVYAFAAAPMDGKLYSGWLVLAVYDLRQLLKDTLGEPEVRVFFQLHDGARTLYRGADDDRDSSMVSARAIPLDHSHEVWTLTAWDAKKGLHPVSGSLPDIILVVCLLFTYFLSRTQRLASSIRAQAAQLYYRSLHDTLTGLPNKKQLTNQLGKMLDDGKNITVVLLDVHGLRLINDSMGHDTGDGVLKHVAMRLRESLRYTDLVARMDGDQFMVVLDEMSLVGAIDVADRLLLVISRPYRMDGVELRLSSNAGVASSDTSTKDAVQLIREADLAVSRARRVGHNTWYKYTHELSDEVEQRLIIRNELQNAIDRGELALHYQPLVDGNMGRLVGMEALLRWTDPDGKDVAPGHLIPLAEDSGLMVPLGLWILDRACRDIAELHTRYASDFPVMVNFSPSQFQRSDFVETLLDAVSRHGLRSEYIEIEVTEGILLDNMDQVIVKLHQLKAAGFRISLDDFGTGYSSLNYLKNLPIDKLKIDRSFVKDVVSDRHDAAITKAIIALAHHLDVKVVAEGVETEAQFWFLKRNFCDEFQGYLFGKPMPLDVLGLQLRSQGNRVRLPVSTGENDSDLTLLLVDDEANILRALSRCLRRDGYRILTASSPTEAFSLLAQNDVQVIISDQRMPEMTGTEFFSRVKEMYPLTVRLVLSGYTDLKSVTDAVNKGSIYRFLTKPWDEKELRREISQAFREARSPLISTSPTISSDA